MVIVEQVTARVADGGVGAYVSGDIADTKHSVGVVIEGGEMEFIVDQTASYWHGDNGKKLDDPRDQAQASYEDDA